VPVLLVVLLGLGLSFSLITLASGGHDRFALMLLGGTIVIAVLIALAGPGSRVSIIGNGVLLGLVVATVTVWWQRRSARKRRLALEKAAEHSDDG
jgi:Flp pilus assembly protein TadB